MVGGLEPHFSPLQDVVVLGGEETTADEETETLEEEGGGGVAGRVECRLFLLVDAPLAHEGILEDLARSEGQTSAYRRQCQRGRHDC